MLFAIAVPMVTFAQQAPEAKLEAQMAKLAKDLMLNKTQAIKVESILKDTRNQLMGLKKDRDNVDKNRELKMGIIKKRDAQLMEVLTKDQFAKFTSIADNRGGNRPEHAGHNHGDHKGHDHGDHKGKPHNHQDVDLSTRPTSTTGQVVKPSTRPSTTRPSTTRPAPTPGTRPGTDIKETVKKPGTLTRPTVKNPMADKPAAAQSLLLDSVKREASEAKMLATLTPVLKLKKKQISKITALNGKYGEKFDALAGTRGGNVKALALQKAKMVAFKAILKKKQVKLLDATLQNK